MEGRAVSWFASSVMALSFAICGTLFPRIGLLSGASVHSNSFMFGDAAECDGGYIDLHQRSLNDFQLSGLDKDNVGSLVVSVLVDRAKE